MTAGMPTENTTAYDLAKPMVEEPAHGIFFAGYANPETPGRLKAAKQGDLFQYCDTICQLAKSHRTPLFLATATILPLSGFNMK